MATDQAYYDDGINGVDALQVEKRYGEERAKRLREDGLEQFVDISHSDKFRHFQEDPWLNPSAIKDARKMFPDNRCRVLILGAGLGGLMYAVRMVEAGVRPEDITIVDSAGGFGGTWYWNRYPGLMCDVESYSYLPLLEETGYMPRHRYAYGDEIRGYANLVAEKWGVANSAVFQTKAEKLEWDEAVKEWKFVATVNGVLNWPKLPATPGIMDYQGKMFHTSRWNYALTGGLPTDPSLKNLQDKRVAIIGTGATAVQVIPHLARWSKHLYVVQRTPSAIDRRDQRETDSEWFHKSVATAPGWQRERLRNFHQQFTTERVPSTNLVDDEWTRAPGLVAIAGNPSGPMTMEEFPAYMSKLRALDLARQNRVRARARREVEDPNTAEKLQAWYPTWCKRPCFHDDYLPSFNRPNVTLLDTAGKGISRLTSDSLIISDPTDPDQEQSYPVDIIIFATGFRSPFLGTPAEKANMSIIGRDGKTMSESWAANGPRTLHGVMCHNFPNLFLSGPFQASLSPSNLFSVDALAQHAAYILSSSNLRAHGKPFTAEPTVEATEDWAQQILMRAPAMAAIAGCTPSYFNLEGALDRLPAEEMMKMAKSGLWGHGVESFLEHVEAWRAEGG
ncbi:hypothetical protein H2203_000140 [Taxawa tesnikishii (nom. ined.)]|nr:hypothetical protein H2203_000140 [Dothideales sp. JES 119]